MSYLVGVDGGGTGCRAAIADMAGTILARAEAGPANIATNYTSARANILSAVADAIAAAGLPADTITQVHAVLGLAGSNLGDYAARLAKDLPFAANRITNDSETTLDGAIGHGDGCIAAIGTGSVFASRHGGQYRMLGGWGFLLGDDGSGARLGKDILRIAIRAHDGLLPHSDLTSMIIAEHDHRPDIIVETARTWVPGDFARLAPRIVQAWRAGDANAALLLQRHAELVCQSIEATGFDPDLPFCMLGGLGPVFLELLPDRFRNAARAPLGTALDGAVALALRQFG